MDIQLQYLIFSRDMQRRHRSVKYMAWYADEKLLLAIYKCDVPALHQYSIEMCRGHTALYNLAVISRGDTVLYYRLAILVYVLSLVTFLPKQNLMIPCL